MNASPLTSTSFLPPSCPSPSPPHTLSRVSYITTQGTYGYLTATGELVLQLAGPTVYVGFDAKPMSIFFRSDVRSTAGGDVTQLRFLIRKTSSNIQVGGRCTSWIQRSAVRILAGATSKTHSA
jgi:hypothetical protein